VTPLFCPCGDDLPASKAGDFKRGITPVENTDSILRIVLISMFFSSEIMYVIEGLRKRNDLRIFAHIVRILSVDDAYHFLNRIDEG